MRVSVLGSTSIYVGGLQIIIIITPVLVANAPRTAAVPTGDTHTYSQRCRTGDPNNKYCGKNAFTLKGVCVCVLGSISIYLGGVQNNNAGSGGKRSSEGGGSNGRHSHTHRNVKQKTKTRHGVGTMHLR